MSLTAPRDWTRNGGRHVSGDAGSELGSDVTSMLACSGGCLEAKPGSDSGSKRALRGQGSSLDGADARERLL
jgi:hypothetical protein